MLNVVAYTDRFKIKMTGHSGYAEPGKDIVCAGASMLFYALASTLPDYEQYLEQPPFAHVEEGNDKDGKNIVVVDIVAIPKEEYAGYFSIMFTQTLNGLQLLAEAYPDNISVKTTTAEEEENDEEIIEEDGEPAAEKE